MVEKKKILMLSDHALSTSGVGTQARWLISGLVDTGRYSFRCFGAAIKHENYDTIVVNEDFVIKPTDGFGDKNLLRLALAQYKPDALMLFTDPRQFIWVWEMHDEVHQVCPIVYNHLWDNYPWPEYNRVLYEATDLVNCINWPTYEMAKERFPDKTNYIPHACPEGLYRPIPEAEALKFKRQILNGREDHFVGLFVGRNARRKMPSDILIAWRKFIDDLKSKHGHDKATLVMHTDPVDREGTNLHQVIELLNLQNHVLFSNNRVEFGHMLYLYNACDFLVNTSCAEGFGLPALEAKMCGKPIIALKTGGLTRQVEDHITGEQYGVALEPEVKSLVGNLLVPYIYEDFVSHATVSNAFMKMYEFGPEKRKEIGLRAIEHVKRDYRLDNLINMWDNTLQETFKTWRDKRKMWSVETL